MGSWWGWRYRVRKLSRTGFWSVLSPTVLVCKWAPSTEGKEKLWKGGPLQTGRLEKKGSLLTRPVLGQGISRSPQVLTRTCKVCAAIPSGLSPIDRPGGLSHTLLSQGRAVGYLLVWGRQVGCTFHGQGRQVSQWSRPLDIPSSTSWLPDLGQVTPWTGVLTFSSVRREPWIKMFHHFSSGTHWECWSSL